MSNDIQQSDTTIPPQQPNQKGCMSGGCLTGCLLTFGFLVVLAICAGVGGYFWVSNQVAKYTSQTPVELPTVEYTPEQLAKLETRLETFKEAVEGGEAPEQNLVLTAEEINALISKEEKLAEKSL